MDKSTVKYWGIKIVEGLVLLLAFLFILRNCSGCDNKIVHEQGNYDSLFAKIKADSLDKIVRQRAYDSLVVREVAAKRNADSLLKVAIKLDRKCAASSKAVRDLLRNGICDSVKVIVALNDCDSLNEANKSVIATKDTVIKQLEAEKVNLLEDKAKNEETLTAAKNIIKGQSQDYIDLKTASKKALRKQKVITWLIIVGDAIKDAALVFLMKG